MDLAALAQQWKQRGEARRRALEQRAREQRRAAREAARVLVEEFGAREVWLFGSLAEGEIHERSDVDLAVAGLPHESYFTALSRVSNLIGAAVDLVPLESAAPSLVRRVREKGVRLDE